MVHMTFTIGKVTSQDISLDTVQMTRFSVYHRASWSELSALVVQA